jgi:glycosidase
MGSVFYMTLPDCFSRMKMNGGGWDTRAFEEWDALPSLLAYKGGNLSGIRSKLDYLSDLGITALLNSNLSSPTYSESDYLNWSPLFRALKLKEY